MFSIDEADAELMGAVLWPYAHKSKLRITKLEILHLEYLAHDGLAVLDMLCSLEDIRTVYLDDVGHLSASNVLRRFSSRLTTAHINWDPHYDEICGPSRFDRESRNPVVVLDHSSSTLQTLTAEWADLSVRGRANIVYPRLKSLTLEYVWPRITAYLAEVYPNLKNLDISVLEHMLDPPEDVERHRAHNISEQISRGSWPSLDTVSGELIDIFVLAIACPVRRLHIRDRGKPFAVDDFNALLARSRPAYLYFDHFEGDFLSSDMCETFRAQFADQVECLEVTFALGRSSGYPASTVLRWSREFFEALDLGALARRFREAVPTLEFVELAVAGLEKRKSAVVRDGKSSVGYETSAVEATLREVGQRKRW
ncbi:uncharacterized protein BXZ73DRAFT_83911 [Epithele typhae]|uniref:uncharacterized protein n=1 Tax=Epithele typhae TaxID=378194 RepID=UPI002007B1F4|nr:uncharacterized protein BXZ73DRAFT_83911 [Epithele typhae]KAH9910178.1 hypothetical protein BXZ73DRAFT_83911 [Epithele typhae]